MQHLAWNRHFSSATLIAVAIAQLTGVSACSTTAQKSVSQNSNPLSVEAGSSQTMDHGSMHHGSMTEMEHQAAMDLGPADVNYDLRFIDAMIPHHQGAIVMAKAALQQSQRSEIKTLAQAIITAQSREINQLMQPWRQSWYPSAAATPMAYDRQQGKMLPMSASQKSSMMMATDLGTADAQFDLRFINAMIPHHEGAIVMAKDALNKSKRPEIQQLAREIIASQQAEIAQMQKWRRQWYGKSGQP